MSNVDLTLIGGKFVKNNLPPERQFLTKYFQSETSRAFLYYYFSFSSLLERSTKYFCNSFIDHTGYYCSRQRLMFLVKKTRVLLKAIEKAEANMDLPLVEKIKSGKFRPNQSHW